MRAYSLPNGHRSRPIIFAQALFLPHTRARFPSVVGHLVPRSSSSYQLFVCVFVSVSVCLCPIEGHCNCRRVRELCHYKLRFAAYELQVAPAVVFADRERQRVLLKQIGAPFGNCDSALVLPIWLPACLLAFSLVSLQIQAHVILRVIQVNLNCAQLLHKHQIKHQI